MAEAEEAIEHLNQDGGKGLPFETEAEDKDVALDNYNQTYYEYEYYKAAECEYEVFNEKTGEWEYGD